MPEKDKSAQPGTEVTTVDLSAIEARLSALETREHELQLKEQAIDARMQAIDNREAEFDKQQAQRIEKLRRETVKVFLAEQAQPRDGKCLDNGFLSVVEAILMGDDVEGADGVEIKLSDEATVPDVHGYYRQAVEVLLSKVPRTVPVGSEIETKDNRPKDARRTELSEARQRAYEERVLAIETNRGEDYELTEEDIRKINDSLDRFFGTVREG